MEDHCKGGCCQWPLEAAGCSVDLGAKLLKWQKLVCGATGVSVNDSGGYWAIGARGRISETSLLKNDVERSREGLWGVTEGQERCLEVFVSLQGSVGIWWVLGDMAAGSSGAPLQRPRPQNNRPALLHRCPLPSARQALVRAGVLQPAKGSPVMALRVALGSRVATPAMRTGATSASTSLS